MIGSKVAGLLKPWSTARRRAGTEFDPPAHLRRIALAVGRTLQLQIYGVDIVEGDDGPVVVDVLPQLQRRARCRDSDRGHPARLRPGGQVTTRPSLTRGWEPRSHQGMTKPQVSVSLRPAASARGQGRGRTADLPLFRRTLVPTELPARARETLQQGSGHRGIGVRTARRTTKRPGPGGPGRLASATPTGLEPAASAVTGRRANQLRYGARCCSIFKRRNANALCRVLPNRDLARPDLGTPNGIRTRATAVKGRGPRPLDDGGNCPSSGRRARLPSGDRTTIGVASAPHKIGQGHPDRPGRQGRMEG